MKVSIIIPTRDRDRLLEKTLASLRSQVFPLEDVEVLVCDHDSSDNTGQVCDSFAGSLNVDRVRVPFEGFSIQRPKNVGLSRARHELSVVLDCGIICPPDFLRAHVDAHTRVGNSYVTGPMCGWDSEEETDFWLNLDPSNCPAPDAIPEELQDCCRARMAPHVRHAPWMLFWGCNFSARTADLRRVGGYDESFVGWGWEDHELGIRLEKAGLKFQFIPESWCLHYPHPRQPLHARMEQGTRNWIRTYQKQPMPELELWECSDYVDYDRNLTLLSEAISANEESLPSLASAGHASRLSGTSRTLYWGFKTEAPRPSSLVSVALVDSSARLGPVYSFGLRTPFTDQEFHSVVMSPYWQFLPARLSPIRPRLLHLILKEALRVATRVTLINLRQASESALGLLRDEIARLEAEGRGAGRIILED